MIWKGFEYSYAHNGFRIDILVTEMVAYDMTGEFHMTMYVLSYIISSLEILKK